MDNRDSSYLPTTQENVNFMNETSGINLSKLTVTLARKYQAEEIGVISESTSTMSIQNPNIALKRENYKTEELIIKTEFPETENEATSAQIHSSSISESTDLESMTKLAIKTEVLDEATDTTSAIIINSHPALWNFAENKDNLKEGGLSLMPNQQLTAPVPVKEKKRPMTAAERARNMRARKRLLKVKKRPMTASERVKKCRELKKAAKKAIPFEVIAVTPENSHFINPDPDYYAQQYLSMNSDGNTNQNQFLNTFQQLPKDDSLITEIKCEPEIDLDILEDNEKPLEICTALFCEPIIEANTSNEQQPINDVEDFNAKRMRSSAERTRKYRDLKKAMANADHFELIGFNATQNLITEPEFEQDSIWMLQESNLKPTAMTSAERMRRYRQKAAERMRRYRQRKKEEHKNKEGFNIIGK